MNATTAIRKRKRVHRAYPTRKWHCGLDRLLDEFLPRCWNAALKINKARQADDLPFHSCYDMNRSDFLDIIRRKVPEIGNFNNLVVKGLVWRLGKALQEHRMGIRGMPRYKSKSRSIVSFDVSAKGGFHIRRSGFKKSSRSKRKTHGPHWGVYIMGLGFCRFSGEPPEGVIKQLTVKRTARRVEFIFSVEEEFEPKEPSLSPVVGIDPGTYDMLTLSNGEKIPGRKRNTDRVEALHSKMDKQKKGSRSRAKTLAMLRKESRRIVERERGFVHETTTDIIRRHGPNIAIERPNIQKMTKKGKAGGSRHRSRRILEQNWGLTRVSLGYKAKEAGGLKVDVDPAYTTSDCSKCGHRKPAGVPLKVRLYECESETCGHVMDRDENAAINMARRGLESWPNESGRIPDGVFLRCSEKQKMEHNPQKGASSRLHAVPISTGAQSEVGNDLRPRS